MKKLFTFFVSILIIGTFAFSNASGQNVTVTGATAGNGSYLNLAAAFAGINVPQTATDNILIEIDLSTTEPAGGAVLNNNTWMTVLIRPKLTDGLAKSISGAVTGGLPLIDLNGADNVTIDGLNTGGNSLTISNTQTATTTQTSTIRFINDATSNTIQNCTISGSGTGASTANIIFGLTTGATGNDGNIITNNNIGPAGANFPLQGVLSVGTTTTAAQNNSGDQINNNNIFDFYNSGGTVANGVSIGAGSTDFTINGNSFYQTASRTMAASSGFISITVANTSGNNFTINNNFIGGSAASAGGTAWTQTGATTHTFIGIRMSVGTTTASNLQGNIVQNISISTSSTSTINAGISAVTGSMNIGTTTANTIGSTTGTGSILWTGAGSGAQFCGILAGTGTPGAITISNNNIAGITVAGAGTTTLRGIRCEGAVVTSLTVSGNIIGSKTIANSIQSNSNTALTGISCTNTSQPVSCTGNTIANIQVTSTGSSATLKGIEVTGSVSGQTISGNMIRNMTTTSTSTSTTTAASIVGIVLTGSATTGNIIRSDTIQDLSNTTSGATGVYNIGIVITSTPGTTISRNLIYNLPVSSTSTSAASLGIYLFNSSATENIINNMIRLGTGISTSLNPIIRGIYDNTATGSPTNIYFNSIYIGGTQGSNVVNTACIYRSLASTMDIKDNILWNDRASTGAPGASAGRHYAIQAISITGTFTSNSNDLYAPNNGGAVGLYTTDRITLLDWQTASAKDGASFSGDPKFQDVTNATAPDLHINPSLATLVEANGVAIGTVTDDFDGQTRGSLTPTDIGADAGDFTPQVNMSYVSSTTTQTNVSNVSTNTTNQQVIGIQIVTTGANSPISATSFTVNTTGTTNTADIANAKIFYTGTTSTFSAIGQFGSTVAVPSGSYNITGTQALAEGTNYFWLTYDVPCTATPANVIDAECTSLTVGSAQVPTITDPGSGRTIIAGPLSGTYTVGTGGAYATLTAAVTALNTVGLGGNTTFSILNSITEAGTVTINQWQECGGSNFTLTIKPAATTTPTISASSSTAVIILNGADRVTIDGSNGAIVNSVCPVAVASRDMTITNTNPGTSSAVVWLQTIGTTDSATHNTIKNCNIVGNSNTTTLFGLGSGSTTIGTTSLGVNNNSNSYENNNISKTQYGIFSQGASSINKNTGTIINQNLVNTISPNNVKRAGVLVGFENNITISGNNISEIASALSSEDVFGISFGTTSISTSTLTGNEVTNAIVSKNIIGSVRQTNTYSACGIFVAPATSGINQISNNMLSGVSANGTSGDFTVGILIGGGAGSSTQIYYNSVSMSGTQTGGSDKSYALAIAGSNPVVDVRNNILVNTQNNGSGNNYAMGYGYSTFTNLTSNNNDFYVSAGGTYFVGGTASISSPTNQLALSNLQTATGKDGASQNVSPAFISLTNLHLQIADPTNISFLNGTAAVVGVTDDIDCDVRNVSTPDIGADEFNPANPPPSISYTLLTNTSSVANRSFTNVTITDGDGVNGTSPLSPRVYYKKSSDATNAFNDNTSGTSGWKYAESNGSTSQFDFTIDYSRLFGGSVTTGDFIQYFVVAQDNNGTPAVGINSGTFNAPPTDVNLAGAFPIGGTINSYKIVGTPLAGDYLVGVVLFNRLTGNNITFDKVVKKVMKEVPEIINKDSKTSEQVKMVSKEFEEISWIPMKDGNVYTEPLYIKRVDNPNMDESMSGGVYATISAAVADLMERGASDSVRFLLNDNTYATETLPIRISPWVGASSTNRLIIKPNAGVTPALNSSSSSGVFVIRGADYVKIDGSNGSTANTVCPPSAATRDFTITNTSTSTSSAVIWLQDTASDGATNNIIENCNLVGSGNTQTFVGVGSGSSTISATSLGTNNNNNSIINNKISKTQFGIYSQGASIGTKNTNTVINQNSINSLAPNNVQFCGVLVGFEDGVTISGNRIAGLTTTNTLTAIAAGFSATSMSVTSTTGNEVTNATITHNIIDTIRSTSSTGFSAIGISIASASTGVNLIANNMINEVIAPSTSPDFSSGIFSGGGAATTKIYYNTVSMTYSRGGATYPSYALSINGSTPLVDVRDNILVNRQTSSGAGQCYAIGLGYISTTGNYVNLTSDNNDLFTSGTSGAFSKVGSLAQGSGTNKTSLSAWNTETGRDGASKNVQPVFISATDLHLNNTNPTNIAYLNATGAAVSVTDDIDCQIRGYSTSLLGPPDIGADEFNAVTGKHYVNDSSLVGDSYTSAFGSDANPGTPSDPFLTINYAISQSNPGDTIYVDAGSYVLTSANVVNKNLTILGRQAGNDAQTRGVVPESVVDATGLSAYPSTAFDVQPAASGSMIDGFTIQGANGGQGVGGIYLESGTSGDTIQNNIIQNNHAGIFLANNSATDQTVITKNLFQDNTASGAASGHGIYADEYTASANLQNVLIDNNTFTNSSLDGMNNAVTNKRIEGGLTNLGNKSENSIFTKAGNLTTSSFINSWALGLSNTGATAFTNITFQNNQISNHGRGMYLFGTSGSSVTGNTFTGATNYAIGMFDGSIPNAAITITGNNFNSNFRGIWVDQFSSTAYTGTLSPTGNTFTGGTYHLVNSSTVFPSTEIDAVGNTYDAVLLDGSTTLADIFTIADKVLDAVDVATYGKIILRAGNQYVTVNSFYVPGGTSTPLIQRGVNVALATETVHVNTGSYTEQVEINKDLTVIGQGAGSTNIVSPASLPLFFTTSSNNYPVIYAHDAANIVVENATVDGAGQGAANNNLVGVAYYQAGGYLKNVEVKAVRNNPLDGMQSGVGIFAYANTGTARTLTLKQNNVYDFQKNGITIAGLVLTAYVDSNSVTGAGPTADIAQNGVQFGDAQGSITNNTISGIYYTPATWFACGILAFDNLDTLRITGNTVNSCQGSIYMENNISVISSNVINGGSYSDGIDIISFYPGENTNTIITNNAIAGCAWGVYIYSDPLDAADAEIHDNSITGSSTFAIHNDGSIATVDAECNWYGTAAEGGIVPQISGTVDYTPWLTNGTDNDPGSIGFQPVPNSCTGLPVISGKLDLKVKLEAYSPLPDTVTVTLRSTITPYPVVDTASGEIDANGDVSLNFSNVSNGPSYYIVVNHRQSIETWSATGQVFTLGSMSYDFTTDTIKAYGNNMTLVGGLASIYTGDVNQDYIVDLTDLGIMDNDVLNYVAGPYEISDLNGDGFVDINDMAYADNNAYNIVKREMPNLRPGQNLITNEKKVNSSPNDAKEKAKPFSRRASKGL